MTEQKKIKFIPFEKILKKDLKNKTFRRAFVEEMNRLQLAHEIKILREKNKMTQEQVATKAKMPQSVIARLESGNHSFSIGTLSRIAGVFNKQIHLR